MPQTVPVGERVDGLNPPGRWVNAVDITRLYVEENRPTRGAETTVEVRLTNRTEQPLGVREPVSINGETVAYVDASLGASETKTVHVGATVPLDAEAITVRVADAKDRHETEDYLVGSNIGISPDPPVQGNDVVIYITWRNRADQAISRDLPFSVDGQRRGTRPLNLGPGESKQMRATVSATGSRFEAELGSASWSTNVVEPDNDGPPEPDPPEPPESDPSPDPDPSPPDDSNDSGMNTEFRLGEWLDSLASSLGVSRTVVAVAGMVLVAVVGGAIL